MSELLIRADGRLTFEIERKGLPVAMLEMVGGQWLLEPAPQSGHAWIAGKRVHWPEALKRALVYLEARPEYDPRPACE